MALTLFYKQVCFKLRLLNIPLTCKAVIDVFCGVPSSLVSCPHGLVGTWGNHCFGAKGKVSQLKLSVIWVAVPVGCMQAACSKSVSSWQVAVSAGHRTMLLEFSLAFFFFFLLNIWKISINIRQLSSVSVWTVTVFYFLIYFHSN